ncbi:MAG: hypothetical protein LBN12_07125 [Clostridiales Family XIII bacterium]|nr:hypothetical protein [Clostridiales Family XIII bacterium]
MLFFNHKLELRNLENDLRFYLMAGAEAGVEKVIELLDQCKSIEEIIGELNVSPAEIDTATLLSDNGSTIEEIIDILNDSGAHDEKTSLALAFEAVQDYIQGCIGLVQKNWNIVDSLLCEFSWNDIEKNCIDAGESAGILMSIMMIKRGYTTKQLKNMVIQSSNQ